MQDLSSEEKLPKATFAINPKGVVLEEARIRYL